MGRTLVSPVGFDGIGVHTGAPCRAEVLPAAPGTGLRVGPDLARDVPVDLAHADAVPGATRLLSAAAGASPAVADAWTVLTPEHLLAALAGTGITDALILFDGPEIPVLDGSSKPWCDAIAAAGTLDQAGGATLSVARDFDHVETDGIVRFRPSDDAVVAVRIDYPGWAGSFEVALADFPSLVAWARTFAFERDVERLRAAGRGAGATLENTVILREDGTAVNALRSPDEPLRHKLLDAVGDLALLGSWRGRVEVLRGSHALHQRALRAAVAAGVFLAGCGEPEAETTGEGAPCLVADPVLDLGTVEPGGISTGDVVLENACEGTLVVEQVALEEAHAPFQIAAPPAAQLDAGERIGVGVDFLPVASGVFEAHLRVVTNDPTRPVAEVLLQGLGLGPAAEVASRVDFEETWIGCERGATLTVTNAGTTPLDVTSARVAGDAAFRADGSVPLRVPAGESGELDLTFAPSQVGEVAATLILGTTDPERPEIVVALNGSAALYGVREDVHTARAPAMTHVVLVVDDSAGIEEDRDRLIEGVPELADGLNTAIYPWEGDILPTSSTTFETGGFQPYVSTYDIVGDLPIPGSSVAPDGIQRAHDAAASAGDDLYALMGMPDDALTLVFLTTREDHGRVEVAEAVARWEGLVDDPLFDLRVHAVVADGSCGEEGARYAEAAELAHGIVRSACEADWGPALLEIGRRSVWDGRTFPTRVPALGETVSVTLDGEPADFAWDDEIGAAVLDRPVDEGTRVVVAYAQPAVCD
jgi:UDP-3-O-[3-hydroxymyristoyl] N-acetylglucosamine deacetylase